MDYFKVGEELGYLIGLVGGITVLVVVLNKQGKKSRKANLLIQFFKMQFRTEDELAWYIAHDMMGAAGYPDCVVYKVDHNDSVCRQIAAYGPKNPNKQSILNPINIPFGRGIVGHVAASGRAERIDDTTKDGRYVPDDDVRYSELCVPIVLNGRSVMVIDSEHKNAGWFKEHDVQFVLQMAGYAAEHLQKIRN